MSKRPISSFFTKLPPVSKRPRLTPPPQEESQESTPPTTHPSYPHPISSLPPSLLTLLDTYSRPTPRSITKTDLELTFHQPFFPSSTAKSLYCFLRSTLPFYRVTYNIKRGDLETTVKTPRYTTVFGVDNHSYFSPADKDGNYDGISLLDSKTKKPISNERYKSCTCRPRPIPQCLEVLKNIVERESGETFNFVLVNYYADCGDSISYHSDDESFLGPNPTIASLSLGTTRDFLMKHKEDKSLNIKLPLSNGELIIMKGATQRKWLHSIPKRSSTITGGWTNGGRINITFRKGMEIACTGNYYRYNVGNGPVYRWDERKAEMVVYEGEGKGDGGSSVLASGSGIVRDKTKDNELMSGGGGFEAEKKK
ncbi:hypothetical protein TWF192_010507 [Orbilia oligospora]|uniref:Uncharacterized protein n=1 Tax=Orbilia oligospora TaxID=2813651 RepID=A0A6G1MIJ7_ORBOL|nr:hypothetical protein TWF679_005213 [Orbilia oligospora]KAF3259650.1 hypothetical protein TWF192_010507 [Orbilia oligospora]